MADEKTETDDWELDDSDNPEDEEEDSISYEISYYPADFTLGGYAQKVENGQIIIPDFQRAYIWDQVRASKLVESFLLGLPVPGVFLYKQRKTNKLLVIDGQQRIQTIAKFIKGLFNDKAFRLRKVQDRWEGKTFEELTEPDRLQIEDSVLRATVVQQLDPSDDSSIYHIFERLNTGGINLNPMEIRKCINHGEVMKEILELNQSDIWQSLIGRKNIDRRMRDAELILRVAGLSDDLKNYEKPMKQFLNNYLEKTTHADPSGDGFRETFSNKFEFVIHEIADQMGEKPFHLTNRLNYAFMDSFIGSLLRSKKSIKKLDLAAIARTLKKNEVFIEKATKNTSDEKTLRERFDIVESTIKAG